MDVNREVRRDHADIKLTELRKGLLADGSATPEEWLDALGVELLNVSVVVYRTGAWEKINGAIDKCREELISGGLATDQWYDAVDLEMQVISNHLYSSEE